MRKHITLTNLLLLLIALPLLSLAAFKYKQQTETAYQIDHEADVKKNEPGSHDGGGVTTVYPFFTNDKSLKMAFRKRVLHPGSSIGYHLGDKQEIYYVVSGHGTIRINDKDFPLAPGDAMLLKPGTSHGIKPAANEDLAVMITYILKQ
jgi:mannose-6-phosphate isomerase-like protein (cupin superfamily)